MSELNAFLITPSATIRDAMACIDKNGKGIALVVGPDLRLIGPISDGDIRRAILKGVSLAHPVQGLLDERRGSGAPSAVTASAGVSDADLLKLMNERGVRQIPIVDSEDRVLKMVFLSDLVREYALPLTAVIMAGGLGTRLRPLTDKTPKPMLPIGDRPMLEWTIEQLKSAGIDRINLTTCYKPEVISRHFGNGDEFGVTIKYLHESAPLGTAGSLGLLENVAGPLLVMNGDILTKADFRAMLNHHEQHRACLTVAVRRYDFQVPYGVVECDGERVSSVSEKPQLQFLVNAGIYLLDPSALQYIPAGQNYDMPDLIQRLISEGRTVVRFPIVEYWLDVGRLADYETAQEDVRNGRISLLCKS